MPQQRDVDQQFREVALDQPASGRGKARQNDESKARCLRADENREPAIFSPVPMRRASCTAGIHVAFAQSYHACRPLSGQIPVFNLQGSRPSRLFLHSLAPFPPNLTKCAAGSILLSIHRVRVLPREHTMGPLFFAGLGETNS